MRRHSCATTSWASDIADRSLDRGKTWPAPASAVRVKSFEIYRYDPDSGGNPPALMPLKSTLTIVGQSFSTRSSWIKNKVDSTLTFCRSCRERSGRLIRALELDVASRNCDAHRACSGIVKIGSPLTDWRQKVNALPPVFQEVSSCLIESLIA
jgi:hypothetical protein